GPKFQDETYPSGKSPLQIPPPQATHKGIGVKNPKPKDYVPRPGTTKNGDRGCHILLLILAWGEEPRERAFLHAGLEETPSRIKSPEGSAVTAKQQGSSGPLSCTGANPTRAGEVEILTLESTGQCEQADLTEKNNYYLYSSHPTPKTVLGSSKRDGVPAKTLVLPCPLTGLCEQVGEQGPMEETEGSSNRFASETRKEETKAERLEYIKEGAAAESQRNRIAATLLGGEKGKERLIHAGVVAQVILAEWEKPEQKSQDKHWCKEPSVQRGQVRMRAFLPSVLRAKGAVVGGIRRDVQVVSVKLVRIPKLKCPSDDLKLSVGAKLNRNNCILYADSLYFKTQEAFHYMVTRLLSIRALSFKRLSTFEKHKQKRGNSKKGRKEDEKKKEIMSWADFRQQFQELYTPAGLLTFIVGQRPRAHFCNLQQFCRNQCDLKLEFLNALYLHRTSFLNTQASVLLSKVEKSNGFIGRLDKVPSCTDIMIGSMALKCQGHDPGGDHPVTDQVNSSLTLHHNAYVIHLTSSHHCADAARILRDARVKEDTAFAFAQLRPKPFIYQYVSPIYCVNSLPNSDEGYYDIRDNDMSLPGHKTNLQIKLEISVDRITMTADRKNFERTDLSKNRLVELPMELCHFVSLEILNLYHNCIRVIPEAIINLQMLTYLNLSRVNSHKYLMVLVIMMTMEVMVVVMLVNKIELFLEGSTSIDDGKFKDFLMRTIKQSRDLLMKSRGQEDVSCNEITALPQQIGQLKSLRELNVRRNYLKVLPQELVDLPLVKFDFSCNKVLVIPICFREMKQLQVLLLENNPLQSPPAQICTKGKVHIFKYLSIQACQIKTTDSLYLHTMERPHLHQHVEDSKKDSDSGVGSDNGDKRLSATEPSDEDTVSLNVPMSNIVEEEQVKEDTCHRLSPVKGEFHQEFQPAPSLVSDNENSGEERDQFSHGTDERTGACEELLRIEEDAHWPSEGIISSSKDQDTNIAMIEQLREAVDLLQDPNRLSTDITERSVVNFYPVDSAEDLELQDSALNGQIQLETSPECEVQNDLTLQSNGSEYSPNEMRENSPAISPTNASTALFGLKPRSDPALTLPPISFNKLTQAQTWDNSSYSVPSEGDSDNVFLRPQRNLESIDPQFTIRRKMEQLREEKELVEQLRESIEMRLKVSLHEDLGAALMDGVVLCHLVNHIRPRSVASIHVPSPAVPKLSMAKCRRNVENFLEACRKLGVPEADLCSPYDILQLDFRHIRKTVDTLLALGEKAPQPTSALRSRDLISFCLVHILFVVLIYITYRWNVLSA
ncbi:hypothetical protein E2I00_003949, partial [Balaenoptera physalus]